MVEKDNRAISKTLFAVILILVVAVAGGASYYAMTLQQTSPSLAPSPSESPLPTQIVTPAPSASSSSPVVTITYSRWMGPLGTDLLMNISIRNEGYTGFDTNATKFYAVLNGVNYKYNVGWTQTYGNWETKIVSNNGAYEGTICFKVPKSDSLEAYTLFCEDNSNSYNIVYKSK